MHTVLALLTRVVGHFLIGRTMDRFSGAGPRPRLSVKPLAFPSIQNRRSWFRNLSASPSMVSVLDMFAYLRGVGLHVGVFEVGFKVIKLL